MLRMPMLVVEGVMYRANCMSFSLRNSCFIYLDTFFALADGKPYIGSSHVGAMDENEEQ
jgi:hypothetical protein